MNLRETLPALLDQALRNPTPEALWALQPALLSIDHPAATAAHDIAGQFYQYLTAVRSKVEGRHFPVLATLLAAGSTGLDVAEAIVTEGDLRLLPLLLDGLHLTLGTLSNYQFVRQVEPDLVALHNAAAWGLYAAYWKLSQDRQPEMDAAKRAELLDALFKIARDPQADPTLRLVVLVRLFIWGLVVRVASLVVLEAQVAAEKA